MQFKLVNLNLWQGGNLFPQILEFIDREKPDILTLQEVYDGTDPGWPEKFRSLTILKHHLPEYFYSFAPAFVNNLPEGKIIQGNAIFSKFYISQTRTVFFDRPYSTEYVEVRQNFPTVPRNLQHASISINSTALNIFNTQGIWAEDGFDSDRRLGMSQIIVDQIQDLKNVILTGDFNVRPHTQTIDQIEVHLTNVFKDELTTTFNISRKTNHQQGYAQSVVDMVFVSREFKVIDHSCPQVDISDHLPLVCTFCL